MEKSDFVLLLFIIASGITDSCTSGKETFTVDNKDRQSTADTNHSAVISVKADHSSDTVSLSISGSVYLIEENGKWGWLDHLGRVVVSPIYDSIGRFDYKGAPFRLGRLWGVVDRNGKIIHEPTLDFPTALEKSKAVGLINISNYPTSDTVYYDQFGVVKKSKNALPGNYEYTLIDKNGNRIGDKIFSYVSGFHEGIAVAGIRTDTVLQGKTKYSKKKTIHRSRYGFINSKGEYIIEPVFDEIGPWPSDTPILVRIGGIKIPGDELLPGTCTDCKYGYINNEGKIVIPVIYDRAGRFEFGVAWVTTGCSTGACPEGKVGLIDTLGAYLMHPVYSIRLVSRFRGDYAVVCIGGRTIDNEHIGGKWGIINKRGEWTVKPEYDNMKHPYGYQDNLILVNKGCTDNQYSCKDGKWGVLHISGKEIVPCVYDDIEVFDNGMARVRNGGQYGVIDTNGQVLIKTKYDYLIIQNDLIAANRGGKEKNCCEFSNGKWTLIDNKGKELLPWIYDQIIPSGRVAVIQQDSVYGVTDPHGKIIIKPEYEEITVFDRIIRVKKLNQFGLCSMEGGIVQKTMYDSIDDFKLFELTKFQKGNAWGYFNQKGEIVWKSEE